MHSLAFQEMCNGPMRVTIFSRAVGNLGESEDTNLRIKNGIGQSPTNGAMK